MALIELKNMEAKWTEDLDKNSFHCLGGEMILEETLRLKHLLPWWINNISIGTVNFSVPIAYEAQVSLVTLVAELLWYDSLATSSKTMTNNLDCESLCRRVLKVSILGSELCFFTLNFQSMLRCDSRRGGLIALLPTFIFLSAPDRLLSNRVSKNRIEETISSTLSDASCMKHWKSDMNFLTKSLLYIF